MGFILFLVSVIVAGLVFTKQKENLLGNDPSKRVKAILFIALPFIIINLISAWQPLKVVKTNAADEIIKINLVGSDRGVDKGYTYSSGWVIYNKWTTDIIETPKSNRQIQYHKMSVTAFGGVVVEANPTFSYRIKPKTSGDMYMSQRKTLDLVEQDWLKVTVGNAINDITSSWQVDSIFVKKVQYEAAISAEIDRRVGKWFHVEQFRTNIVPPGFLVQSIQNKVKAMQDVDVARERKKAAEAQGLTKIAAAKADSADKVIRALADARVNELKAAKLSEKALEERRIIAWEKGGSQVPTTLIMGNTNQSFLHSLTGSK